MTFPELVPVFTYGDLVLTDYPFAVNQDGIDFQSGDLVVSVLSSFLLDGDLEVSSGRGNMTLVIPVLIEGGDLLELAEAQALLAFEAQKSTNTFTIDPGDGIAPPTVFETFQAADVAYTYNARAEQGGFRQFNVTISALPFGRSVDMVLAPAVTTPVTAVVDSGSSATPWTAGTYSISATVGTATPLTVTQTTGPPTTVSATSATSGGNRAVFMVRSGTIDTSVTNYLVVDWKPEASALLLGSLVAFNDITGKYLPVAFEEVSPTAGYTRTTFFASGTGVGLRLFVTTRSTAPRARSLFVDNITRTNVAPAGATSRSQVRTVVVAGSARTQGGLVINSATAGLGDVFVYTFRGDSTFVPMLRPFYTSGAGFATDASTRSGGRNNLSAPMEFIVPIRLLKAAGYGIIARLKATGSSYASSVKWTAQTMTYGNFVGRQLTGTAPVSTTSTYAFVSLGVANLPPAAGGVDSECFVRITIEDVAAGNTGITCDDVYLPNLTDGRYSIVRCGSGSPVAGSIHSRLLIDPATVASRTPTFFVGRYDDGSDAYFAGDLIQAEGFHEFVPPTMKVFVSADPADTTVDLSHYPRWFGHAA